MDIYESMSKRFSATPIPKPTGELSKENEKLTQWYLEQSFFCDFVYRNPERKKGKEFSDALVIYDDTIVIVQNKTQLSPRDTLDWSGKNINSALRQLRGSYRMIRDGIVHSFENDMIGSSMQIDLSKHKNFYGLVILAQVSDAYDPTGLLDESCRPNFPFTIMSLDDFFIAIDRIDTAGDLITYLEMRYDASRLGFVPPVNDEVHNMRKLAELVPKILEPYLHKIDPVRKVAAIEQRRSRLTMRVKERQDYIFSTVFYDMIAHAHDVDPAIFGTGPEAKLQAHRIAEVLGYVARERRIEIGKRLLAAAEESFNGIIRIITHVQKPISQTYIYIFTSTNRKRRQSFLASLTAAAQKKYGYRKVFGMATEPVGTGGRSYDFVLLDTEVLPKGTEVPKDVLEQLPEVTDRLL